VKDSQSTIGDAFVCNVCERVDDEEDISIQENTHLGNGVCLDRVERFCYLGDILSGGTNSASVLE